MTTIRMGDLPGLFAAVGAEMEKRAAELCEMDARMGDGDLGLTMKKGFAAMPSILEAIDEPDLGKRLMKAGMKMAALVPSTMGTLMASGVMGGGKALTGRDLIDAAGYRDYLVGFAEGIARRGKCSRGDRTVLDAIGRAADKLAAAIAERPGLSLAEAAEIALLGAREGVEATRAMEPKFGKAAVHRLAAVGQADQGACAGMYMIAGYRDFLVR
ncbi:MAG: dihydroxyacetone kinase subunit L [Clostridiales bacterium]|nr:dihydroxyacetone kinase subunit L [Clostridiales bacterium]